MAQRQDPLLVLSLNGIVKLAPHIASSFESELRVLNFLEPLALITYFQIVELPRQNNFVFLAIVDRHAHFGGRFTHLPFLHCLPGSDYSFLLRMTEGAGLGREIEDSWPCSTDLSPLQNDV